MTSLDSVIDFAAAICHPENSRLTREYIARLVANWPSRDGICLYPLSQADKPSTTRSYFGGAPTLPAHIDWPIDAKDRALVFLGQIDCAELPPGTPADLLPDDGILFFFVTWDCEWGLQLPNLVLYSTVPANTQPRAIPPNVMTPRALIRSYTKAPFVAQPHDPTLQLYARHPLRMGTARTLSCVTEYMKQTTDRDEYNAVDTIECFEKDFQAAFVRSALDLNDVKWLPNVNSDRLYVAHRLFGSCTIHGPRAGKILMAQFDTDDLMEWDWNRQLRFWITEEELAARDFSKVEVDYS